MPRTASSRFLSSPVNRTLPSFSHRVAGPAAAPWVTFISGIGNDGSFWQQQAAAVSHNARVLTFDPWGHGASPAPPQDCTFDDVLQGVLALWNDVDIRHSAVVGLGFGGSVALALGLVAPERVTRVVACCCRAKQPDDRRDFWRARREAACTQGMQALADATVDRWLSGDFRAAHPDVDATLRAMMKRTSLDGYRAYVGAFIEMDFDARLDQLSVPTLLVAAEHDHGGGPVEDMRRMAVRIPGARLEVVQGSGHICNHEASEAVTALLQGFLHG
jgi:3-oxoadipate enol-lactonase